MSEYRQYRRTAIAELAEWHPGMDLAGVSISDADRDAGSPKAGDMIARNPKNHDDRWLVAADYFAANFEPLAHPGASEGERYREALDEVEHFRAWLGMISGPFRTAREAVINRAREVAALAPEGQKADRDDYTTVVSCGPLYRLARAVEEMDRQQEIRRAKKYPGAPSPPDSETGS